MEIQIVMINDDRTGRLKRRTVNVEGFARAVGEKAAQTDKTIISAEHGGTVCNSYGYAAETEVCVCVALAVPGGAVVAVYAGQIQANKATLAGAAGACLPVARPVFDWRYGDKLADAARCATIAEACADLVSAGVPADLLKTPQELIYLGKVGA